MLKGKIAIVTGASRGIGKAIALKYARNGAKVALVCLKDKKELNSVKSEIELSGSQALCFIGDIGSIEFCTEIVKSVVKEFGTVDILVNSAGTITRSNTEEMTLEEWQRVISTNLNGVLYLSQLVLPILREKNEGKIVNLTSQMAYKPHPSASPSYEVSKSGVHALSRHLALEYAKYNVCINNIAPGSIDTDLPKSMTAEQRRNLESTIPFGRLGSVDEVADSALFLASKMSNYITGSTIHINGGSLII